MFPSYKYKNPPLWLERNRLFRKLYVLRRLAHHTKHVYFSDTDTYVKKLFKHLQDIKAVSKIGFYVDVGCFHPVNINTTYALYRQGWRGINIDVDSIKVEAFDLRRPRDINIACAVSDKTGEMRYWRKGLWSGLNSLEESTLEMHEKSDWREIQVKVDTLTNLIDQTSYKDSPIDFLSVDVEGHELAVLRSLDFSRYKPKAVCVETWSSALCDVIQSDVYRFMEAQGYVLVNWIDLNLIFLHKDYPPPVVKWIFSKKKAG